jgi:hypothetical protein
MPAGSPGKPQNLLKSVDGTGHGTVDTCAIHSKRIIDREATTSATRRQRRQRLRAENTADQRTSSLN